MRSTFFKFDISIISLSSWKCDIQKILQTSLEICIVKKYVDAVMKCIHMGYN